MAFGSAERGSIVYAMGTTQHANGTENVLALANLALVTGNLGREGTGIYPLCGPPMMINAVAAELEDRGFRDPEIFISLERHMKCGVGTCEHCTLGPYHVCQEGPIFSYDKVKGMV